MNVNVSAAGLREARLRLGIAEGKEKGMYAPLVKRYPIRIDDQIPAAIKQNLMEHTTCACTDSNVVYIDTELACEMFDKASKANGNPLAVSMERAIDNYKTLLVHEYTHIIMQHVKKGAKFVRANGDKYYPIFALACDIEANRGYGINKWCDLYKIGVTEDYYPECKGVEGLMNIYRVLKKNYKDDIMKDYEDAKNENENENDESVEGESNDENSSTSAPSDSKAEQRSKAIKNAISSMEQMREEIEQSASMVTEDELDKDVEQFDENNPEATGTLKDEAEANASSQNPYDVLHAQYDEYLKRCVEKGIEKLKGLVRGNQVRNRVGTYSRQSRRAGADGLIRKGIKNEKSLAPRILVAMDSSGSMSSAAVTSVATAIGTLAKMLGKTKGSYICEHDSRVKHIEPLSNWEEVVKCYYPDGDNDFDELLQAALRLNVEVVIDVGDGYARLWDEGLMKQAKKKGLKWFDVQVRGEKDVLEKLIREDAANFGENFIGREIIKVGEDN